MPKIDLSQAKWERKMADAGPRWKKAVTGKEKVYAEGLTRWSGEPTGPTLPAHYKAGVEAVTPEDFQEAVRDKGAVWRRKILEAIAS